MATIVPIEWMNADRKLSCPCCGKVALNADGHVATDLCPHFVFLWDGSLGGFVESSESADQFLNSIDSYDAGDTEVVGQFPSTIEVLQIDIRKEACGLIEQTDFVAFDRSAA